MGYRSRPDQSVDPLRALYGNPFEGAGQPSFIKGTIIDVQDCKCTVLTEAGETFCRLDWPDMNQSPSGGGCTVSPPELGTTVILRKSPTGTVISQTLALSSPSTNNQPFSVSDSNTQNVAAGLSGPAYKNILPTDAQPGDWVRIGNQGQKVGILEGGAAVLSAAPWAAVRVNQKDDTVQVLGRNLEIQTGFGQIKYRDAFGKQSFSFEGGTDRLTETGTGLENWTVRALIGGLASGFADLQFKKTDGDNLLRLVLDGDGTLNSWHANDINRNISGRVTDVIGNGRAVAIAAGDDTLDVAGSGILSYGGSLKIDASKNITHLAGNDLTAMIKRNWIVSAGQSINITASGPLPTQGDIMMRVMGAGSRIILDTPMAPLSSIMLGSTMGVAPFHAVKFETLSAFLSALITYIDTHMHPTGVGPSGVPIVPSSTSLSSLITPIMSLRVLIGA
jgi:hypothetical protein